MNIFGKKKNGDYFVQMIESLTEIKTDCKHFKGEIGEVKSDLKERDKAEYERRKIDREWQKGVDSLLSEKIECPKGEQIEGIQADVNTLKSDKQLKKGKFLGMKLIWVILIGALGLAMLILNIMWKLGML